MIRLKNAGTKIAIATIAAGLAAGAAFASDYTVGVTLPQAVTIGQTTLPSGAYTIQEVPIDSAASMFLFRDNQGKTAAVTEAWKVVSPPDVNAEGVSQKTDVILNTGEDGKAHLSQMFVEGDTTGYTFVNSR